MVADGEMPSHHEEVDIEYDRVVYRDADYLELCQEELVYSTGKRQVRTQVPKKREFKLLKKPSNRKSAGTSVSKKEDGSESV